MKKSVIALFLLCAAICSCTHAPSKAKVMARYVPEMYDDFFWENDLVCYRVFGPARDGNPTSPGFDVWVKQPGKLVMNDWYKQTIASKDGNWFRHDHEGKDCYKMGVSLGAGASAPIHDGLLFYPERNYSSWEIVSQSDDEIEFILRYRCWEVAEHRVCLEKKISVSSGSRFCKAEDLWKGDFDSLDIAVGLSINEIDKYLVLKDRFAIWEHPSDISVEPEDGMIGLAIILPGAKTMTPLTKGRKHYAAITTVHPGDTVTYWFGSCWSKAGIQDSGDWFRYVMDFDGETATPAEEERNQKSGKTL